MKFGKCVEVMGGKKTRKTHADTYKLEEKQTGASAPISDVGLESWVTSLAFPNRLT